MENERIKAMDAIKQNDRIGWGIIYSENEKLADDQEQLVICYLTINRRVSYLRVLFQPPGGFYPVVIAPPNGKVLLLWLNFE